MMFKSIVSAAMLVSSALAAVAFNDAPFTITAGTSYTVTWTATGTGPVNVQLRRGVATNLLPVQDLTTSGTGGSLTFTAPSLPSGTDYAFYISQGTDINFWGPISLIGTSAAPSSAAPSSAAPSSGSVSRSAAPSVSSSVVLPSASHSGNVTLTLTTSTSRTSALSSRTPTPSANVVPSQGGAAALGSPLALVLSAMAAMLYFQ